jgi:predicted enzyme related to lactoylglutathione lyase
MVLAAAMIYVRDFAVMREFYRRMLETDPVNTEWTESWAWFREAGLALHAIPEALAQEIVIATPPVAREDCPVKLIFRVDDVTAERGRLAGMGVRVVERPWQSADGAFDALDPEGNVFQVSPGLR